MTITATWSAKPCGPKNAAPRPPQRSGARRPGLGDPVGGVLVHDEPVVGADVLAGGVRRRGAEGDVTSTPHVGRGTVIEPTRAASIGNREAAR